MRHALNILAEVAPDWLIEQIKPEWAQRYQSRFSDFRLPKSDTSRLELAEEIGADGRDLLEKVYTSHAWLQELPAIERVRCIWIQQYHASEQGAPSGQSHLNHPSQNALEIGVVPTRLETFCMDAYTGRWFLA